MTLIFYRLHAHAPHGSGLVLPLHAPTRLFCTCPDPDTHHYPAPDRFPFLRSGGCHLPPTPHAHTLVRYRCRDITGLLYVTTPADTPPPHQYTYTLRFTVVIPHDLQDTRLVRTLHAHYVTELRLRTALHRHTAATAVGPGCVGGLYPATPSHTFHSYIFHTHTLPFLTDLFTSGATHTPF